MPPKAEEKKAPAAAAPAAEKKPAEKKAAAAPAAEKKAASPAAEKKAAAPAAAEKKAAAPAAAEKKAAAPAAEKKAAAPAAAEKKPAAAEKKPVAAKKAAAPAAKAPAEKKEKKEKKAKKPKKPKKTADGKEVVAKPREKRVKGAPRNYALMPGLMRFSAATMYKRRGIAARKRNPVPLPKKVPELKVKPFGKKGETRVIKPKAPKFYPTEPIRRPIPNIHNTRRPTKLRKSITPGTVLILLAGHFRGRRVVFLKQLKSGLLLVTGPYKINGVPLRRVNQRYVIATSTKVDISAVKLEDKINDDYFRRTKQPVKKSEAEFFKSDDKKFVKLGKTKPVSETIAEQKAADEPILKAVSTVPLLKQYLGARFNLKRGQYPHSMKF